MNSGTHIKDGYGVVEGSLSRETDLADVRIHLVPIFTISEPLTFLFSGLYERLNQEEKSCYDQSNEVDHRIKKIIESIPAEILQRIIGEFSRRIRNCIIPEEEYLESE